MPKSSCSPTKSRSSISGFVAGVLLAGAAATLLISRERSETRRLREQIKSLQIQGGELARLEAENVRLSKVIAQSNRPFEQTNTEMLRLRGEVGRLRRELDNSQQQTSKNLVDELNSSSIPDQLAVKEVDLNAVIDVGAGAATNDVLSELKRIGAQLVSQEPGLIVASVSIATTNVELSESVIMRFYFDGDGLNGKEYMRLRR